MNLTEHQRSAIVAALRHLYETWMQKGELPFDAYNLMSSNGTHGIISPFGLLALAERIQKAEAEATSPSYEVHYLGFPVAMGKTTPRFPTRDEAEGFIKTWMDAMGQVRSKFSIIEVAS